MIKYNIADLASEKTGRTKGRELIVPPPYSLSAEMQLYNAIMKMLRAIAAEARKSIVAAVSADKRLEKRQASAFDTDLVFDAPDETWFARLAALQAELAASAAITTNRIFDLEGKNRDKAFMKQAKKNLGIDLDAVIRSEDILPAVDLATAQASALITNIGSETVLKIKQSVYQTATTGAPIKDLQDRLKKDFGFSQKRAKLVARDQIAKFSSNVDRIRQQQAGIGSYEWLTSQDERVRDRHRRCNGRVYAWGKPTDAEDGLPPGQPIQCRCVAQGVVTFSSTEANEAVAASRAEQNIRIETARVEIARREAQATSPLPKPTPKRKPQPSPKPTPKRPPKKPETETKEQRNARLDDEGRNYVLDLGRQEAREHLTAYDADTGFEFSKNAGEAAFVALPPEAMEAIKEIKRNITVHHNHPSSSSFSIQDLAMTNYYPGLRGLWAHGHDGSSFYTEAGSRFPRQDRKGAFDEAAFLSLKNRLSTLRSVWDNTTKDYLDKNLRNKTINSATFNTIYKTSQLSFMDMMEEKGFISNYKEYLTFDRKKEKDEVAMFQRQIRTEFYRRVESLRGPNW